MGEHGLCFYSTESICAHAGVVGQILSDHMMIVAATIHHLEDFIRALNLTRAFSHIPGGTTTPKKRGTARSSQL